MSIYNRRMFNRNARNALNASAGIQSFAPGGPVQLSGSTFYPGRNTVGRATSFPISRGQTTAPRISLTRPEAEAVSEARNAPPLPRSSIDRGFSGMVGDLFGGKTSPRLGIAALQQGAKGLVNLADIGIDLAGLATSPFGRKSVEDPPAGATTSMAKRDPETGDFIRNPDGSIKVFEVPLMGVSGTLSNVPNPNLPTTQGAPMVITPGTTADDLQGVDITTLPPGIAGNIPQKNLAFPNVGVQAGQAFRVADPGDRTQAQMLEETLGAEDADLPKSLIDPPLEKAILEERAKTDTDSTEEGEVVEQEGPTPRPKDIAEKNRKKLEEMNNVEPEKVTPEDVAQVVNSENPETQEEALARLMKEFTQNAPEYKGIDTGLAIAKIGFAMAAGESPDALVNIAKALEEGADMFIEDAAKKDAFIRQVDLSGLEYGLGEISKERAQERIDERTFTDFVNDSDKAITYKGVKYQPGRTIRVSNADYLENGGKLPPELITEKVYTSNQAAILQRAKANDALLKENLKNKTMTITEQKEYREDYAKLVDQASQAETAGTLIESVIRRSSKIVGAGPALKQTTANFLGVFGLSQPKGWNDQKLGVQDLKAALQSVVPATLGKTQSANSISNRDVDLLIQGFLADGIMDDNKDGTFAFVATTQETFINSLQNGLRAVRNSQAQALRQMSAIDLELQELYTPSGRVATSITDPIRAQGIFTPGGTAKEGFEIQSMTKADDGIFDVNPDFFG